jgi:uncharacterized protein YndB with AHSA1/START domain
MTIHAKKDRQARAFEMSIDIDARSEDVWRALTDAGELVRWFPLEAHVVPGKGGTMRWGWADGWSGQSHIVEWEPNRRLKLVETRQGFDADGKPLDHPGENRDLVVEVTLESHAGTTRLRLVNSGFGAGADWDDELDGVSAGWQSELRNLRHYLEHHRGRDRVHAWAKASSDLSPTQVWRRLLQPDALAFEASGAVPREGERFALALLGERFEGTVALSMADDFMAHVDNYHDGTLRVGTFRGGGRTGVMVILVSYEATDAPRVKAFERAANEFLAVTFAGSSHALRS